MMTREAFLSTIKNLEQLEPSVQSELLKEYRYRINNNGALANLQGHINACQQGTVEVWKTGFPALDKKLDGGFYGEQLIFLGAISSLGKTSFALQIATQIAEQGQDVLIFSLEMSKNELNAKIISRYSYIQTQQINKVASEYALTTRDILSGRIGGVVMGEEMQHTDFKGEIFVNAYKAAKEIADRVFIFVGENDISVDDVRNIANAHKKLTGRNPFVILDYLQILQQSEESQASEKRLIIDYDVTRLKILSRNLHIPVMVISAFNRNSYLDPVSMGSFKESSGIEYSSDILLGMQYFGMEYNKFESEKEHNMNVRELLDRMNTMGAQGKALPIELKILKNRNGTKGSLFFDFYPAYNYYKEGMTNICFQTEKEPSGNKKKSKASSKKPLESDILGEV